MQASINYAVRNLFVLICTLLIILVLAAVFINPIELIRTKMQSMRLGYGQLLEAIKVSFAAEGFGLMFKGLGPALLRDVPFSGNCS
jgi:Mitochondrial carrier protein